MTFPFIPHRQIALCWGLVFLTLLLSAGPSRAQQLEAGSRTHCLMLPLAPARRAEQAQLIVEAQVLDAVGFWDAARQHIFTRHRLLVFSVLKGALADATALAVVTEGGQVGPQQEVLTNTLRLHPDEQGIFFLTPAPWVGLASTLPQARLWTPYGSEQGFIKYEVATASAAAPFETYPAINAAFYQTISAVAGGRRLVLRANPALDAAQAQRNARPIGRLALTINGLEPTQLTAGTGSVLTINGEGFGASRGTVQFANADDGGRTFALARNEDYLSWSDNQIRVRVPSFSADGHPAGSGRVQVTPAGQSPVLSQQPLTVVYALTNAESAQTHLLDRPGHNNVNGHGGISFELSAEFRASPAAAAWRRALVSWRCNTGVNWDEAPAAAASSSAARDQHSVVSFDASNTRLPTGVLGRTSTYYTGCVAPGGAVVFAVAEVDMQFSQTAAFQFGPALAKVPFIDFETVAIHELGHAQLLSHLNLPGAVMHYSIDVGQNTRQLNPRSDIAGGRLVLRSRSFVNRGCGQAPMLPAPLSSWSAEAAPALSWTTRDECFLTEFVVERSLSGDTTAWEMVATLPAGRPDASYTYTDAQPASGLRYFRLRLRRPDGSLDTAVPLPVSSNGLASGLQFFPNPVSGDQLQFIYAATAASSLVFVFYDELGRYRRAIATPVAAQLNVLPLNVAGLAPGFYVLTWRDTQSGRHGSQRLVRQ